MPKEISKPSSTEPPNNRPDLGKPSSSVDSLRKRIPEGLLNSVSQYSIHIATEATKYVELKLPFFAELPAIKRADVQFIVQTSVSRFVQWVNEPITSETLTLGIDDLAIVLSHQLSLQQSVEITRKVLEFFEHGVPLLAQTPKQREALRELVLRYGWEIGFASAATFADVAETRGSLDSRIEASLVDAIIRGEKNTSILSQAAALNIIHNDQDPVTVIVSDTTDRMNCKDFVIDSSKEDLAEHITQVHRIANYHKRSLIAGIHGSRLIILVVGKLPNTVFFKELLQYLPEYFTVIGPTVQGLHNAHRSAKEALAAIAALPAWIDPPKPVYAVELLAERSLLGDILAKTALIETIVNPILKLDESYLETLDKYIATGTVEITAADLYVHPNTVRYRLKKIADITGFDLFNNRDAFVIKLAFIFYRLPENLI